MAILKCEDGAYCLSPEMVRLSIIRRAAGCAELSGGMTIRAKRKHRPHLCEPDVTAEPPKV